MPITSPEKGPPPDNPPMEKCRCAPYTIIGPCLHAKKCSSCTIKANPDCKTPHCNRCAACIGLSPRPARCAHPQCPHTCKHRRIELWQQYFVDDGDLIANTLHGLRTRTLAAATIIYAFGMSWKPSKCHYLTNMPAPRPLKITLPHELWTSDQKEFTFKPADICSFYHKLLGVHLSLNAPTERNRGSAATNVAQSAMHRVITQARQHIRTTTMLRQVFRWCATSSAEYRLQVAPIEGTEKVLLSLDKRMAT